MGYLVQIQTPGLLFTGVHMPSFVIELSRGWKSEREFGWVGALQATGWTVLLHLQLFTSHTRLDGPNKLDKQKPWTRTFYSSISVCTEIFGKLEDAWEPWDWGAEGQRISMSISTGRERLFSACHREACDSVMETSLRECKLSPQINKQ